MFLETRCYAVLSLFFCISFIDTKKIRHHAEEFEHQELLFAKLTGEESGYNKLLRPSAATIGNPLEVKTSLYVYGMSSLNEIQTDYSMQMLYRQTWIDDRLKFPVDSKVDRIVGDKWHTEVIWTPSIHAVNDKDFFNFNNSPGNLLVHIHSDGTVLLSKRVKLRIFCKMQFQRYPMDEQQCTLELESSVLPSSDLALLWNDETPLDLKESFLVSGFALTNYSLEHTNVYYKDTGNFSRITVRLDLQRQLGHFVLDIYIPSALFVVTSWLSFWIEVPAAPARVTLGMTTMLTLTTSEKAIRDKLPKISYIHALDIWNVVCTGFVFASLVEYALVNYIYHKDKRRRKNKGMKRIESSASVFSVESIYAKKGETEAGLYMKKSSSSNSLADLQSVSPLENSCVGWILDELQMTPQDVANAIDRKCRYLFPGGFFIFNVVYWLVLWL